MSNVVQQAFVVAELTHQGQLDDAGECYFDSHIRVVADLVRKVCPTDRNLIAAAYLHDIIEDTYVTEEYLRRVFSDDIVDLVMEVTHEGKKDQNGYYFPRLETQRGIILKFADRLSNVSRMEAWDDKRQQQYLRKSKFWKSNNGTE